jgi:hypothetical protein
MMTSRIIPHAPGIEPYGWRSSEEERTPEVVSGALGNMRPRLNGPIASGAWHEYGEPVGHRDHEIPVGFKVPLE